MLASVAQGRTNRQIGAELFIGEKTACVHVSNRLAELGASAAPRPSPSPAACSEHFATLTDRGQVPSTAAWSR